MAVNRRQAVDSQAIEEIVGGYPPERRYALAIMQDLQRHFNYLPRKALKRTAVHVKAPLSAVFSMATFYKAFSFVPKGRVILKVCDGTACHIKASHVMIGEINKALGIKPGETTPDGEFSLETVNCLGACVLAPVLVADEKIYAKINPTALREIIERYQGADR